MTKAFTPYHAQPVLDLLGKYESKGDYDIVYGGIPKHLRPIRLVTMTVAQVQEWQNNVVKRGVASTAAGKYQIIRKTLASIIQGAKIDTRRKFDEACQDEMGCYLLQVRGFQKFLEGKIDADDMALNLAKEWASMPVPTDMRGASRQVKAGQSYYAGDGLNKAHATVAEVERALGIAQERYRTNASSPRPVPKPSWLENIVSVLTKLLKG